MRPQREHATHNQQTYMVSSRTWGSRMLFRHERWANLFVETLYHYRGSGYLLHAFVLMPDHFHVLITPTGSLERAVQYIKGGFSHRAKAELGSNMEIWQKGFTDHRIRDAGDGERHVEYIHLNPVRKRLCEFAQEYPYSSAYPGFTIDEFPQRLKPENLGAACGAPEGAPFQSATNADSQTIDGAPEGAPFQSKCDGDTRDTSGPTPLQNEREDESAEAAPLQRKS